MQALVGHPLDTIKVRMQTSTSQATTMSIVKDCLKNEGFAGFFKGLSAPLLNMGVQNAAMFTINGTIKQLVANVQGRKSMADLTMSEVIAAAWMTAPLYCLFVTPVDVVKSRLQVQKSSEALVYSGPIDVIRKLGVRGLFKGYLATCAMRFIGSPAYFGSFEFSKRQFKQKCPEVSPFVVSLAAGSIAGVTFWGVTMPIDTIKTNIQTAQGRTASASMLAVVKSIYKHDGGVRGFYRGFLPCIVRAGPSNAVAFLGLDMTLRFLGHET